MIADIMQQKWIVSQKEMSGDAFDEGPTMLFRINGFQQRNIYY
jgi:hypothetical protein